jgi:VIT1/CCC1 family predicted Fe2+/Mn2+ transporter
VVDVNDGIVATGGIVEGFIGAGVTGRTVLIAALAAMAAGGIALGGAKYAEAAAERDAERALIEEERRQLEFSPEEELAELTMLYEEKGLSAELALRVASELTAKDALAAHVDVELGLASSPDEPPPLVTALAAGVAFALGSFVPVLSVLLAPDAWRMLVTFGAVVLSLAVTSLVLARMGRTDVVRTIARTVLLGVVAMVLTLAGGSLFST